MADRLDQLYRILAAPPGGGGEGDDATSSRVRIGNAEMLVSLRRPFSPELIPFEIASETIDTSSQEMLGHLRWMIQKGSMFQDMFLLGPPTPLRRSLALFYAQLGNREVEYIALSRDISEGDLKQRREILGGTSSYSDQACLRAAIHGRILILDGIEKAERNVLPALNNLLENREMSLEDGRFLVHPKRYDELLQKDPNLKGNLKLIRCHENFLVIALGLPTPKYEGYPLDPPFRSRFQARYIANPSPDTQIHFLSSLFPKVNIKHIQRMVGVSTVIQSVESDQGDTIPDFPVFLNRFFKLLNLFPRADPSEYLPLLYPFPFLSNADHQMKNVIFSMLERFQFTREPNSLPYSFAGLMIQGEKTGIAELSFKTENESISIRTSCGNITSLKIPFFVETAYHSSLLTLMMQAHAAGGDICLIGEKGTGKSLLVRAFAQLLGYKVENIPLYKDMSARDLLQRRTTNEKGDTVWENSGLVNAALNGHLAVLDPLECLPLGTLSSIQRLIAERNIPLPGGGCLCESKCFDFLISKRGLSPEELRRKMIFRVHPSFRIVAMGRPPSSKKVNNWLNGECLSMFSFIPVRPMNTKEEGLVLHSLFPGLADGAMTKTLISIAESLRAEAIDTLKDLANSFSTRCLIRIARRISLFPGDSLYSSIMKTTLFPFLPILAKEALVGYLKTHKIEQKESEIGVLSLNRFQSKEGIAMLRIGKVEAPIAVESNPLLIPKVLFYENQKQLGILQDFLKDYLLGEHLLLIGNQGVGKNMIVDYFLYQMNLPREYIQLHRDTTVYSLTSNPTIVNGKLCYEDSPLVKAVREGSILVVDEADKAPTHVTSILKSLIEDREMVLSDGRRIINAGEELPGEILMHRNFRMIVLANRPGFPFMGNDFFKEIGDIFAVHCVENPDPDSELELLRKYGGSVSVDVLKKLIASFQDLRRLVDDGIINYPYSTRELVNVVKHLEAYSTEGIARALENCFAFDSDREIQKILLEIMNKNGIPTGFGEESFKVKLAVKNELPNQELIEKWKVSKNEEMLSTTTMIIHPRGTWKLDIPSSWVILQQKNGRSNFFSEWLYSFRVEIPGKASDIILGTDHHLYQVNVMPASLIMIAPDHRKYKMIQLNDFIPSSKTTMLRLIEYGVGKVAIHNSTEHSIIFIDLLNKACQSISLPGFDPVLPTAVMNVTFMNFIVIFQPSNGIVFFYDFSGMEKHSQCNLQHTISFIGVQNNGQHCLLDSGDGRKFYLTLQESQWVRFNITATDQLSGGFTKIDFYDSASRAIGCSSPDLLGASLTSLTADTLAMNGWPRNIRDPLRNDYLNIKTMHAFLKSSHQMVNLIPSTISVGLSGWLELVDPLTNCVRTIIVPIAVSDVGKTLESRILGQPNYGIKKEAVFNAAVNLLELPNGDILFLNHSGECQVLQTSEKSTLAELKRWENLTGGAAESGKLKLSVEGTHPNDNLISSEEGGGEGGGKSSEGSSGKGDGQRDGEGGEGQGSGGPGSGVANKARESGKIDENFILRSQGELKKEISEAQVELHFKKLNEKLKQMNMTGQEFDRFSNYRINVQREIRELHAILESVEAKNQERVWLRNQTSGDIDDSRLVEGLAGDKAIYRMRGENDDIFQQKPKRIFFVFDLSASMMRFNGHDSRMDRTLECALMLMEAFKGYEHKFAYHIFGHSGDGPAISMMPNNIQYPKNEKEIFDILTRMQTHASYTMSGDNTLLAISTAITNITKGDADDYFVLVISDANLHQYNITADALRKAMEADSRVNTNMIFIGNVSQQADRFGEVLTGNSFNCYNNKDLPKIIKSVFLKSMLK